ncbi:MAG: hypothetical protein IPK26_25165 [Planctomycetes bacterium]|nr:hypothetical protein [Planctomycetota bacterium]
MQVCRRIATVVAPPARADHALAFDLARGRTVLFGGHDNSGTEFGDTWEYDGMSWTPITVGAAPAARHGHALAYHSAIARTVLYGGRTSIPFADTWLYDGTAWTRPPLTLSPPAASEVTLAYDPHRARTVLLQPQGTWEFDGARWLQVETTGSPPDQWFGTLSYDVLDAAWSCPAAGGRTPGSTTAPTGSRQGSSHRIEASERPSTI